MTFNETNLTMQRPVLPQQNQGWICPKCGNVYAPYVQQCKPCNKPDGKGVAG